MVKKEFQSAPFSPPGRWTGNNFLFKGGLIDTTYSLFITRSPLSEIDLPLSPRLPIYQLMNVLVVYCNERKFNNCSVNSYERFVAREREF